MEITSAHNEALKEIRKLAGRRWRDKLGEFVAEGEDLLEAADAAGWQASMRFAAKGSGLVSLEPSNGGTLLRYDYEAEVSGKVAASWT